MSRFLDDIRGGQVGAPWYTPPEKAWMPMHVRGSKGEKPAAREVEVRV